MAHVFVHGHSVHDVEAQGVGALSAGRVVGHEKRIRLALSLNESLGATLLRSKCPPSASRRAAVGKSCSNVHT